MIAADASERGRILVVDDNSLNRALLTRVLEAEGFDVATAENGNRALELLRVPPAPPFDVVLLDVLMPERDGYSTLSAIKTDDDLRHLPVIMITAVDELASVVRCIELGATDYLSKPFNAAVLRARINASLSGKRLRDLELEYLEQVDRLTTAAADVEAATFAPEDLETVASRTDALGQLARVFQRMAIEVHAREQRLKRQLQQVMLDMEERRLAAAETVASYVPIDRRLALAHGEQLPERTRGAAVLVDVSGFTTITAALGQELGLRRGAEELIRLLNRVFAVLIDVVHDHRGSVIAFGGDAMSAWFDSDDGLRAVACAVSMQRAMDQFAQVTTPAGNRTALSIKVAIAAGTARRLLVGHPDIQVIEVLAGSLLDGLTIGERLAGAGEIIVRAPVVESPDQPVTVTEWRTDIASGERFAVVTAIAERPQFVPWPVLGPGDLSDEATRPWLLPPIYERVAGGKSAFLAELRPAAAVFVGFQGIDFDNDERAGQTLDDFVRWVQDVLAEHGGSLLQVTIGDKGSYLYAAFGAPVAHDDDAARAMSAALDLLSPPVELGGIGGIRIGVAHGLMRAGTYGGPAQRTYGVQGIKTNFAARLMEHADDGILCDEAIARAVSPSISFEAMPPITGKHGESVGPAYRPVTQTMRGTIASRVDRLSPSQQLTLKVASVIGTIFSTPLLHDIYPVEIDRHHIDADLEAAERAGILVRRSGSDQTYGFSGSVTRDQVYRLLLFSQRRTLHRAVAEWYERTHADDLTPVYELLATHWEAADDLAKASHFLELAGSRARDEGATDRAARLLRASLNLAARDGLPAPGERAE